ncbi:MAG: Mur ligase domain-containing protein [Deltaproteobacteria bacterium]|jgi:UDP-N-acetylmuramate: L-alanyl-gamma-D-glutamyl-meso-diaminopimelate ligase|nr:Mur ligase domain-containing protein [Deltaproteobacteria bacterium]
MVTSGGIADLDPALNRFPSGFPAMPGGRPPEVFLLGVGGVAMASLAGLMKDWGCSVSGADEGLYPPMRDLIEELGIPVHLGYGEDALAGSPDLVVVGNVVTRSFPVAAELLRRKIPYVSLPQALEGMILGRTRNLVVSGCHGKTTLTALSAHLLSSGGLDPGYLVGGAALGFPRPFAPGGGRIFVIEGDEYDCAFFDKRPKFVHYRPHTAILTSVEFDHADIYPDLDSVVSAYRTLAELVPPDGLLVANGDDPLCAEVARSCRGRVELYGESAACRWKLGSFRARGFSSEFTVDGPGGLELRLRWPRIGRYNALGACAAVAAVADMGLDPRTLAEAFASFRGVRRRQEPLYNGWAQEGEGAESRLPEDAGPGSAVAGRRGPAGPAGSGSGRADGSVRARPGPRGVTVVDDFAHHPTAVAKTLGALKEAFPERRLVCAFEPRSNTSRRTVFQDAYPEAFRAADRVLLSGVDRPEKAPEGDRLDLPRLRADIGPGAVLCPDPDAVFREAVSGALPGDLFCVMSNGAFGGLAARLAAFFGSRAPGGPGPEPVGL